VLSLAGARLDAVLRPDCCVIYARAGGSFAPVFSRGKLVPPAFDADNAVVQKLEKRTVPLLLDGAARRQRLDAADLAAVETLGVEVLLPIIYQGTLAAFVCLGHKRSGDVYIATDIALLTAVANRISTELQRFTLDDVRRQARAMQDSLRRYVPGAVARHLEVGHELEAETRDVSILFVDIRGYTTFSESRSAQEIFQVLNRYTEAVSGIVRKHLGSLVEFHGDGLMVVFGAPEEIQGKERFAVRAAREVVAAVKALALGSAGEEGAALEVGVGIATGPAFVGNIRAVDRMIWGAVGNTTNLAARLQSLSRELRASIVIDSATYVAADGATEDFRKHAQVSIKGRARSEDVYALALAGVA
jgi:class 3 adenylate cyclase